MGVGTFVQRGGEIGTVNMKKQPALRLMKVQAAFSALRPFNRPTTG